MINRQATYRQIPGTSWRSSFDGRVRDTASDSLAIKDQVAIVVGHSREHQCTLEEATANVTFAPDDGFSLSEKDYSDRMSANHSAIRAAVTQYAKEHKVPCDFAGYDRYAKLAMETALGVVRSPFCLTDQSLTDALQAKETARQDWLAGRLASLD
ncbi:MAG: hypothetical protein KC910_01670 [Candidatus Eremiobacteraeota bacterium]|nr:hypothetical protein [Candidatus Eremiobacteraeota bacterium]